jgi:glycosyltransferase involved in cell wall biosynthesis
MLAPGKDYGARELFTAFAKFQATSPDARLIVYGPATDWSETDQLATECGARSVLRLGQIERGEALAVIEASDVFVRPTLVDGDAVSVREAIALGRRVVATQVGTRPASVTLCAPADADDLARALTTSLAGPLPRAQADDGIVTVLQLYARMARLRRRHSEAA